MKKVMTVVCAISLTITAVAQRSHGIGSTRVIIVSPSVGFGYAPFYNSAFGYSPFGYSPFGYPYAYNNGYSRTSKLDMKVSDIKADYKDKIRSAKHDSSISKEERKKIVSQLKSDRDNAIHDLKSNYYKPQKASSTPTDNNG